MLMETILLLSFQFWCFFFLVWFFWLELPVLYWIRVVRVGILVLFMILQESSYPFTMEYNVSYGLVKYGLYYVEICSFYIHFIKSFYNKLLNLVKCFYCIYWDDHRFLSITLLMWCDIFIDLWMLKHLCIPGINLLWSCCMTFMMHYFYCWSIVDLQYYISFRCTAYW